MGVNYIICEGESELEFLKFVKKKGFLINSNAKIVKFQSWTKLRRITVIAPGYDKYYFIHDTDDMNNIKKHLEDLKGDMEILLNDPNFDHFIADFCGIKYNNKNVLKEIEKVFGKKKIIDLNKMIKIGGIKNIKHPAKYGILVLLNFNI